VRDHITPDPSLSPVVIPGRTLNEICAHAREAQPEECCGLVSGLADGMFRTVHRCRNEMTARHGGDPVRYPRDGREAFYMSEIDYLKAQRDAEARGERVTAVYHSHVDAGAWFSQADQAGAEVALFPFPEAAHIVVSIWDGKLAEAGIFQRTATGFEGRFLEVAST